VGTAILQLVSIVSPVTMRRWLRADKKGHPTRRRPGRPRTPMELEQLIIRMAKETGWGYARIAGELRKLKISNVCRSTVANILKRAGLDPSPVRKQSTWDEFIKRHAQTLWGCDFMSRKVLTPRGWREAYVLVFINVKSRLAWISPTSFTPDQEWTNAQFEAFAQAHANSPHRPGIVLHDRDTKFGLLPRANLVDTCQPMRVSYCSPNLNAYAERFIQKLQQECLDHFVVFGCRHLDHLLKEFLEHYQTERPHQGIGNVPLKSPKRTEGSGQEAIRCRSRLGGLLRHYHRKAA